MELDLEQFKAAFSKESKDEMEAELKKFIDAHPVLEGVNVQQIIAIAQAVCTVSEAVCPYIMTL